MKLTWSLVLLFDCFFRYSFQVIFTRFGVFSDCLERKKKKRDQFSRSRSNCRLLIAISAAIFPISRPRDILPYSRSLIEIEDRDNHLWSIPYQFILNQVTSYISSEYGTQTYHIECTYQVLVRILGSNCCCYRGISHDTHHPTTARSCLTEFQIHVRALWLNPSVLILTQVLGGTRYTTVVQGVCRAVCWLTLSRRLQYSNGVVALASVRTRCWVDTSIGGHVASDGVPG